MKPMIVGLTGASGVIYGVRLVRELLESSRKVFLVVSEPAQLVLQEELRVSFRSERDIKKFFPSLNADQTARLEIFSPKDFTAPIASGSFPVEGMVIIPCSMGTLGAVAGGISQNLIHRAADCIIKEGKRLVLVPRETPLNAIHLENMLKLARLGVRMVPAMPAFYTGAYNFEGMVDFIVGKVLDQLELPHSLYARWTGRTQGEFREGVSQDEKKGKEDKMSYAPIE